MSTFPKKVCLIIPPSSFLLDERVFMSLGILKVAAVLRDGGYHVELLDLSGISNFLEFLHDYVKDKVDVFNFGITSTTPQFPATVKIVETLRKLRKESRIILGGPHITLVNAAYKKEILFGRNARATRAMYQAMEIFDVLVAGDGEERSLSHLMIVRQR